jgi:hypothetical protein
MTLQEIFDQLSYGELSQISMGGSGDAGINEANWERVLASVNLGLTELHKRFLLKEGRIDIQLEPGKNTYVLDKKYAQNNRESFGVTKYLLDSPDAVFENNVLKIERVYDDLGNELGLNQGGDSYDLLLTSCRTPSYNTLVLPVDLKSEKVTVVYRENHPIILKEQGYFALDEVEVTLPYSHLEALLLYVASRIMNPIGVSGSQGQFHEGNNYAAKFEAACSRLEQTNLRIDQSERNSRLERNGWV